jgi:hypothetical protein
MAKAGGRALQEGMALSLDTIFYNFDDLVEPVFIIPPLNPCLAPGAGPRFTAAEVWTRQRRVFTQAPFETFNATRTACLQYN